MAIEWNPKTGTQMAAGEPTIAKSEQLMKPAVMPGTGGLAPMPPQLSTQPMPMRSAVMPPAPTIDRAQMEMLKQQQMAKPAVMPPAPSGGMMYPGGSPTFNESAGSQTIGQPMPAPTQAPIGATPPGANTGGMAHVMWEGPGNPAWEARQGYQAQIQALQDNRPISEAEKAANPISNPPEQQRLAQMIGQNQRMQIPHMGFQPPQPQMMQPPGNAYGKGGQQPQPQQPPGNANGKGGGMQNQMQNQNQAMQQGFQSRMAGAMGGMNNQPPSSQAEPQMTNDMGMGGQPQTPPGLGTGFPGQQQPPMQQQPGKGGAMGGYTPPNNIQRPSYGSGKGGQMQQPTPPPSYGSGKGGGYQSQRQTQQQPYGRFGGSGKGG